MASFHFQCSRPGWQRPGLCIQGKTLAGSLRSAFFCVCTLVPSLGMATGGLKRTFPSLPARPLPFAAEAGRFHNACGALTGATGRNESARCICAFRRGSIANARSIMHGEPGNCADAGWMMQGQRRLMCPRRGDVCSRNRHVRRRARHGCRHTDAVPKRNAESLSALAAAMNDRAKLPYPDRFPAWRGQPRVPLDAPWLG